MADTREADPERRAPAKKGLHGWKAAGAVFGCGTLAAFGVFGVIVGVLSLFINSLSSGISTEGDPGDLPGEGIGAPRSSLEEGQMNVCEDNLDELTTITAMRQDSGENYVDTADPSQIDLDGALRVVKDECLWQITPEGNSAPWDFYFSYEAVIDAEAGENRNDIASGRFEELKSELPGTVEDIESVVESPFGGDSYSVYGAGESGQSLYVALLRTRSAVYSIHFEGRGEQAAVQVSEGIFLNEARKISNFLKKGFEYWIPGDGE
ncbi:hypothetical protein ACWFMI_22135 [Nocardiopsis terrae]